MEMNARSDSSLSPRERVGVRVPFHEAPVEKATPFSALRRHETPLTVVAAMGRAYGPLSQVSTPSTGRLALGGTASSLSCFGRC